MVINEFCTAEFKPKISMKVREVLNEFENVMSDELPPRLVLGTSLPNLLYYLINLNESKILQQIIDKLLEKRSIRVSISPCVVLAILTLRMIVRGKCVLIAELSTRLMFVTGFQFLD